MQNTCMECHVDEVAIPKFSYILISMLQVCTNLSPISCYFFIIRYRLVENPTPLSFFFFFLFFCVTTIGEWYSIHTKWRKKNKNPLNMLIKYIQLNSSLSHDIRSIHMKLPGFCIMQYDNNRMKCFIICKTVLANIKSKNSM